MDVISAPTGFADILLRLTLATVCGAAVGANREFRQKPAGLRTHALVALGAGLLAIIGLQMEGADDQLNAMSRVIQGVVVGVGFIGGGAIFRREAHQIEGLSTAAGIWVVAAAGIASAAGLWRSALVSTIIALVILIAGAPLDRAIRNRRVGDPQ